jgi:hypothetical protein
MTLLRFRCPHCRDSSTAEPGAEIIFCPTCGKPVRLSKPKPKTKAKAARAPVEEGIEDVIEVPEASPPPVRRKPGPENPWETEDRPPRPRRRRSRRRVEEEPSGGFWPFDYVSGYMVSLLGLGLLAIVLVPVSCVFPPAGAVCMVIGFIANVAGAIWILMLAARDGEVMLVLLVPFYGLFYILQNLGEAGKPFLLQVVGSFMIMGGAVSVGAYAEPRHPRRLEATPPPAAVARAFLPVPSGPLAG